MKKLIVALLAMGMFVSINAQVKVKALDPAMMAEKVLYIPDYNEDLLTRPTLKCGTE